MKFYAIGLIALAITFFSCTQKKEGQSEAVTATSESTIADEDLPKFEFENKHHSFGTVTEGDVVQYAYKYTNVGKTALIITQVRPGCGCTAPNWSKEPLAPGESAELAIAFNSTGKSGKNHKSVTIYSNTKPATTKVTFDALVNKPE